MQAERKTPDLKIDNLLRRAHKRVSKGAAEHPRCKIGI